MKYFLSFLQRIRISQKYIFNIVYNLLDIHRMLDFVLYKKENHCRRIFIEEIYPIHSVNKRKRNIYLEL